MAQKTSSAFSIQKLHLLECSFGNLKQSAELRFNVGITSLERVEEENTLRIEVGFDLMHDVENPPCTFSCKYRAIYQRDPDSAGNWNELKDHVVLAHLVPFLREFICTVTMRTPLTALMIAPINTSRLIEEYKSSRQSAV